MNRNVESHFSEIPQVDLQRSVFDRSCTHKTSLNVGDLVPVYVDEVLPGDSFRMTTSKVVRLQTLLTPVMDNLYMDTYWFFVPNRLVWDHWKEFCGENTQSAWIPQVTYQIPSISSPEGGFITGTLADYFGLPVGVTWDNEAANRPSALPFRGYALICNEFFRDENLTDPLNIPTGDSNQTGSNGTSYISDVANGGMPFKVAKYHDYFTSCLPSPQKGPAVNFTFDGTVGVQAPLLNRTDFRGVSSENPHTGAEEWNADLQPDDARRGYWVKNSNFPVAAYMGSTDPDSAYPDSDYWNLKYSIFAANPTSAASSDRSYYSINKNGSNSTVDLTLQNTDTYPYGNGDFRDNQQGAIVNQYVDMTTGLTANLSEFGFTINQLRLAFQLQKFYERNARGGSRYIELLKSHFGVTSPDSRLQRPEYLGGNRIPVSIHEVTNNAQSESDFLGDLGANSVTSDIHDDFEHSFTEHGYLFCLVCMRYDHSYPQGLEKMWTRRNFTDFYLPVFANIGEQPVDKSEIYADASTMDSSDVWGYQEAWAEYRYKPDRVSGEMRPGITNTLASWHFADYYTDAPTLSDGWIREDKTNVDRALAVTSTVSNQAFMDIYFKNICTRCMPMYSIPGLIDHH